MTEPMKKRPQFTVFDVLEIVARMASCETCEKAGRESGATHLRVVRSGAAQFTVEWWCCRRTRTGRQGAENANDALANLFNQAIVNAYNGGVESADRKLAAAESDTVLLTSALERLGKSAADAINSGGVTLDAEKAKELQGAFAQAKATLNRRTA